MDTVAHAALAALSVLFTPLRLGLLCTGVVLGLVIGIVPGLGGIVGLSLVLPFTYKLDPYSAMAVLMGLAAAVSHADVIPAVLFGVPGTVGCAATVMDGYPMAKRGEGGRALGAAFSASLLGGIFGAILLALTIPVIRPVILLFGSPQMLAICVFGMTLVASVSGRFPLKGVVAACAGLLLSMIGADPQTSTPRFAFGSLYLWDGLPIVPVALGLFAIPELCDIFINRTPVAESGSISVRGQWAGWQDTFRNWFLVLRTAALGSIAAMVPGLGAAVVDWIAYGHAVRTEKHSENFGNGDVRGVIAAESSTNAREGGSLVPTIAFGVPAHASMAILLSAFLIQGIVPGPDMLSKHLDITYTIVWSLAAANVIGTLICFMFANKIALIATIRYTVLLPIVTVLVYIGAFQGQRSWGDLFTLLLVGAFSWLMKRCDWPRAPLILGFILGPLIERYLFLSVERYNWGWLSNWFVVIVLLASAVVVGERIVANTRARTVATHARQLGRSVLSLRPALAAATLLAFVASLLAERALPFGARLVPQIISTAGIVFAGLLFISDVRSPQNATNEEGVALLYRRAAGYFSWALGVLVASLAIGLVPALTVFVFAFMRFHGREKLQTSALCALAILAFLWGVFGQIVHEPWPQSLIGDLFPVLRGLSAWF